MFEGIEFEGSDDGRDALGVAAATTVDKLADGSLADCGAAGLGIAPTGGMLLPNGSDEGSDTVVAEFVTSSSSAASGSSAATWRTA